MDSFEINKIFGALLGTVFVLFGGSLLAEAIFHSEIPEQPGYAIEAVEESAGGTAEEVAAVPIATLLQSADAEAGATVFRRCQSCHSAEEGAPAGVGPHLWSVVNRPIATDPGFSYSTALTDFSEGGAVVWDYDHLNHFLTNPRQYVSGTAMSFAGISNDSDRANVIAYLRTLSNEPVPLPEPPAEEAAAPEGEAPPADGEAAPAEGEAAPAEGEAAPATEDGAVTDPGVATDSSQPAASQPQGAGVTDPAAGAAPISGAATTTTGQPQAGSPAAQPNQPNQAQDAAPTPQEPSSTGQQAPAENAAPAAQPAPSGQETPAEQPAAGQPAPGTTIVPAQP